MAEGYDKSLRSKAASETLRSHFSDLVTIVSADPLGMTVKLYSKKIVEKISLDKVLTGRGSDMEKACYILNLLSDAVKINPEHFILFCETLESEERAKLMKEEYQEQLRTVESKQETVEPEGQICNSCSSLQKSFLEKLHAKLAALNDTELSDDETKLSVASVTKAALKKFVMQFQQSDSSLNHVNKHLQMLHEEECLIADPALYQWALQQAIEEYAKSEEPVVLVSSPTKESSPIQDVAETQKPPLFSKSVLWHASICCRAVSTCDAGNYQSFFKNKKLVHGHTFKEVSVTRSKQDRLLIAIQEDSTFYFAFQSEPIIAEWPKRFKSFHEGIEIQGKMIPIHFIVELLNAGECRIVLTGFSFGGLLASYIATQVWNPPYYISSRHLKENLICITFAQPHVSVPGLDKVARERPEILETIHHIYYEEDLVPRLVKYLDKPCSTLVEPERVPGVQMKVKSFKQNVPFRDPLTLHLFQCLKDLQGMSSMVLTDTCDTGLSTSPSSVTLKDTLKTLTSNQNFDKENQILSGPLYLLACPDLHAGLHFIKLPLEQALIQSAPLRTHEIQNLVLPKHSVDLYSEKLFLAYLQQPPEYMIPSLPKVPKPLNIVKPTISSLVLHEHGNEFALALEGSNLWFCYQMSVGGVYIETSTKQIVSGTSIKFNTEKKHSKLNFSDGEKVNVTIHSYFTKPSAAVVTAHKREYHVSLRQQQLARLTPSQLIELSYLSALLELHPHKSLQSISDKVLVIRHFLEDVVQVVPVESICYAIAYGSSCVAARCAETLSSYELPKSKLMVDGLMQGNNRLTTGLSPDIVKHILDTLVAEAPGIDPQSTLFSHSERTEKHLFLSILNDQSKVLGETCLEWKVVEEKYGAVPEPSLVSESLCEQSLEIASAIAIEEKKNPHRITPVICGLNIGCLYPITTTTVIEEESAMVLESPISILRNGKKKLADLVQASSSSIKLTSNSLSSSSNSLMLQTVNNIRETDVATCTSLLGAFMEQQEIDIPLIKSKKDHSKVLELSARASVGVWALSNLNLSDLQDILKRCHGEQLLVKIENYVKGIISSKAQTMSPRDDQYAAKLQFIIQGVSKTVTCNSQYISYSLERQLVELCNERNITADFPLGRLTEQWELIFENNILSLVAKTHRPLLARWLKWALMVHNLREKLAKYTAVGVIGLVNSGKSRLVNNLFGIEVPSGTTEGKRTTVPFMYNLEQTVEGLDVVDFPGVDDRDETISDLADLLLTIAQIIVFVVDYRKIHTESGKKWLERLQIEKVPVLVCLTFADKLYAEHMTEDGKDPDMNSMSLVLEKQLSSITEKLELPPSFRIKFFSFSQDRDSVLNCKEGRQKLRSVSIGTHLDVGDWLVETFKRRFGQDDLADRLHEFIHSDRD